MIDYSPFLPPGDSRLDQTAPLVPTDIITTPAVQDTINKLLDVARQQQTDLGKRILVGLAATQIGINQRIMLTDTAADGHGRTGHLEVLINPVITWHSRKKAQWYEGCYSTGPICGIVDRFTDIKVSALDRQGTPHEYDFHGYNARVVQHEIDHLNGIVFISHITNPDNLHWVQEHEFAAYRDQEQWRHWPHKCSFESWQRLKQSGGQT